MSRSDSVPAPTTQGERTFGSLNAGDCGRTLKFSDHGLTVTGTVKWVWHRTDHKGEAQTQVTLEVAGDEVKIHRPALTQITMEATP